LTGWWSWLLLRNRENPKDGQAVRLQKLLAANQPLAMVYPLKDALKEVWYAPAGRLAALAMLAAACLGQRSRAAAAFARNLRE